MITTTAMTAPAAAPLDAYNLEAYLLDKVGPWFRAMGELSAPDFLRILYWKSPRATGKHVARLEQKHGGFAVAVTGIAATLHAAPTHEARLLGLLTRWGFRLPAASAVLTILWPDDFTVYDVRVCDALQARNDDWSFHKLQNRKPGSALWMDYERFLQAVVAAAPAGLSLRDADRWLWGEDAYRSLLALMEKRAPSTKTSGGR